MSPSKSFHQSRKRCQHIGSVLLEGPDWIVPPTRMDRYGWLDPVLKIVSQPAGINRDAFSCAVFTDGTINRDKGFLSPLVRRAEWNRSHERKVNRIRKWPKIRIAHHILEEDEYILIDDLLKQLDQSLSNLDFLTGGLITDRSTPEGCHNEETLKREPRFLQVDRWNSCQHLRISLGAYTELNETLRGVAHKLVQYARELCEKDEAPNYRERYSVNLETLDATTEWFYRPPHKT